MLKNVYYVLLLTAFMATTGCETMHGAACGFGQDVHNASDSSKNGWDSLKKADAWMQQNMW